MKSLLIILVGLVLSVRYTDLSSDSAIASLVAPFGIFIFFISLALWLVMLFHNKGIKQQTSMRSTGVDDFGDFGDGGGSD